MGKFRIKYLRNETKNIILTRIEDVEDAVTPEDAFAKLTHNNDNKYPFMNGNLNIIEIEKIE